VDSCFRGGGGLLVADVFGAALEVLGREVDDEQGQGDEDDAGEDGRDEGEAALTAPFSPVS